MKSFSIKNALAALLITSLVGFAATKAFGNEKITPDGISYSDKGEGTPLVLIHAFPADKQLWVPQQEGLASTFRIISIDLAGFGKSKATDGKAVSMREYAQEVKSLLDYLHINKAIIGGESMGGYVVLEFLNQYPEATQGVILSNTQTIADSPEEKQKRETVALDVLQNGTSGLIEKFLPKTMSPDAPKEKQAFLKAIFEKQAATGLASALRGMGQRNDNTLLLQNAHVPILIITGDKDQVISTEQSEKMHQLIPNSHLIVLHGAGHLTNVERSNEWNQAVIQTFH